MCISQDTQWIILRLNDIDPQDTVDRLNSPYAPTRGLRIRQVILWLWFTLHICPDACGISVLLAPFVLMYVRDSQDKDVLRVLLAFNTNASAWRIRASATERRTASFQLISSLVRLPSSLVSCRATIGTFKWSDAGVAI